MLIVLLSCAVQEVHIVAKRSAIFFYLHLCQNLTFINENDCILDITTCFDNTIWFSLYIGCSHKNKV